MTKVEDSAYILKDKKTPFLFKDNTIQYTGFKYAV